MSFLLFRWLFFLEFVCSVELLLLDGVLLFSGDVVSGLVLRVMSIWVLFFAAFLSFWLFSLFGGM